MVVSLLATQCATKEPTAAPTPTTAVKEAPTPTPKPTDTPKPAVPQVLRRRVPGPMSNVWPNRAGGEDRMAVMTAYAPPYWPTPDRGRKLGYALSHEWADDGMSVTIHIDPEAVFSNGKPITAQAVKKWYEWAVVPDHAPTWGGSYLVLKPIKGVEAIWEEGAAEAEGLVAVDDHTLRIEFGPTPFGWDAVLDSHYLGVSDAEAAEEDLEKFTTDPVTSGPYLIHLDVDTGEVTLDRNPNWWREPPNMEKIIHVVIPDEEAAFIAFDNGEFDMLMAWLGSAGPATERWPDYAHLVEPRGGQWYFSLNCTVEPTDDVWVRRALLHAIDRHSAVEAIAPAAFSPIDSVLTSFFPCFDPDVTIPYDPDLAREELAKSSYGSADKVPQIRAYYYAGRPVFGDLMTYFQDQWKKELGLEVSVQEWQGAYPDDWNIGRKSFGASIPDESYYLSSWMRLDGTAHGDEHCATEETDALCQEADSLPLAAQEERCKLYRQAEDLWLDQARMMPMVETTTYWIIQPWIKWDEAWIVWPYLHDWAEWTVEAH